MTHEQREYIARRGSTYWLISEAFDDRFFTRVGYRKETANGIAAAVRQSSAFVLSRHGEPVPTWSDEDGIELDDEYWELGDFDGEDDDEMPEELLALRRVVIKDSNGVVLVGPLASTALPTADRCFVMAGTEADEAQIIRVGIWSAPVTISINGVPSHGIVIEDVADVVAVRLGKAFGNDVIWELMHDTVRMIDCEEEAYVATTHRDWI